MTHIGFTGTRYGMSEAQQAAVLALLVHEIEVANLSISVVTLHHGCCEGADKQFHAIGKQQGTRIVGHPMIGTQWQATHLYVECDELRTPKQPLVRNGDIVEESRRAMIAAPFEDVAQDRGGTWATIRMARKAKRPLAIVWRSGEVERWP
jgi:hypothetical protein